MPEPSTTRRWFKWSWLTFSLRSMFVVVTVVACCLWYGFGVIRERHVALRDLRNSGAEILLVSDPSVQAICHFGDLRGPWYEAPVVPFWRCCCGDEAVYSIKLSPSDRNKAADVQKDFPEARVE